MAAAKKTAKRSSKIKLGPSLHSTELGKAVHRAARAARNQAQATNNPDDIAFARALDALDLIALRSAQSQGAHLDALTVIEKVAVKVIASRKKAERWYGVFPGGGADGLRASARSAQAPGDRSQRMIEILHFAKWVKQIRAHIVADRCALMMVSTVRNSYVTDTSERDREADIATMTTMVVRALDRETELAPELLVTYALRACGVRNAANWVRTCFPPAER